MNKGIVTIDYQECMSCGVCVQVCPWSYLELSKTDLDAQHKPYPVLLPDHACNGCDLCVIACPVDCMALRALSA